jgi:hypothetical protein
MLVGRTKQLRLGLGTLNMPNIHPAAAAEQVAMLDHLLEGLFILGISPGGLLSDAEIFGNLDARCSWRLSTKCLKSGRVKLPMTSAASTGRSSAS